MRILIFCFVSLLCFCIGESQLVAQSVSTGDHRDSLLDELTDVNKRIKNISAKGTTHGYVRVHLPDSLANLDKIFFRSNLENLYGRNANGLLIVPINFTPFPKNITFEDTVIYNPAYLPVVFDGKVLPPNLDFMLQEKTDIKPFHLIDPNETFAPRLSEITQVEEMRKMYYMNNPLRIESNALYYKDSPVLKEKVVEKHGFFGDLLKVDDPIRLTAPSLVGTKIKEVYWLKNGDHIFQISQNEFSEKWGSGNNVNYLNIYNHHKFNLNYRKKRVAFNNLIEWRLDAQRRDEDTPNKVKISEDFLRTYSTFGIDAFKKRWSYSSNLEMKSPMFNRYDIKDGNRIKTRALFSPFEMNLGVGMRYKLENKSTKDKYPKLRLEADISALSLNYRFVEDKGIKATWFGIEEGKDSKTEYGSTLNVLFVYDHNRFGNFSSRLKYFTNYERAYVESENSVNFSLNRYLSTTIYVYLKYDDAILVANKDEKLGYLSYNEMLRFGFTYKW